MNLPKSPNDWTREHFADAVRQYLLAQATIDENHARIEQQILELRKSGVTVEKQIRAAMNDLRKRTKKAFPRLCAKNARRIETPYGVARFRTPPASLARNKDVTDDDVIARAEELGFDDRVVKISKSVQKEVVETLAHETIADLGYHWTDPKDKFEIVAKK